MSSESTRISTAGPLFYLPREDVDRRARSIRLLLLDVDGVLTECGILIDSEGNVSRRFFIRDGLGIKLLLGHGVHVAIITFANNHAIKYRAEQLGIHDVHIGAGRKDEILDQIRQKYHLQWEQTAFMGDDWIDMAAMNQAGMAFAPADAIEEIQKISDYVATTPGGLGAVREVCDEILKAQNANPLKILTTLKGHD